MNRYNYISEVPCKDFHDAIPLGNGDMGASVWTENSGDLVIYISKTDAYDENNHLLKLGRVRVRFTPNPFSDGSPFREELDLQAGELCIDGGKDKSRISMRVRVDANMPFVRIEASSEFKFEAVVSFECWRDKDRTVLYRQPHQIKTGRPGDKVSYTSDTILSGDTEGVVWYHHNKRSLWNLSMRNQGLESLIPGNVDPLLDRIFGGAITGDSLEKADSHTLRTSHPSNRLNISICALTAHPSSPEKWLEKLERLMAESARTDINDARKAHAAWWRDFWNRSRLRVSCSGGKQVSLQASCSMRNNILVEVPFQEDATFGLSQAYALQRYIVACGGRGNNRIISNGSIFTLPWEHGEPDFRRWDGYFWFQNMRLIYWPLIACGDYEMFLPLFNAYRKMLPLAIARTKIYYGHEGAFFPETQAFWGTFRDCDYGWKPELMPPDARPEHQRKGLPSGTTVNQCIRYYWQGGLELVLMMLEYYAHIRDAAFFRETLSPIASAVLLFYENHWGRGKDGKILFYPSESLETWHETTDPTPDIAGLRDVSERLVSLPSKLVDEELRQRGAAILAVLPELPTITEDGKTRILPARKFDKLANWENPELYAVFPYHLYGVGKPDIATALNTFDARLNTYNFCWWQNEIHLAFLGRAKDAAAQVLERMNMRNSSFRFPVMFGPFNDEIPDLDHGGSGMIALQSMLMQCEGPSIRLFPAWPKAWDVDFKLHAPDRTVVEGELKDGKLSRLQVTPSSRVKDVIIHEPQ